LTDMIVWLVGIEKGEPHEREVGDHSCWEKGVRNGGKREKKKQSLP